MIYVKLKVTTPLWETMKGFTGYHFKMQIIFLLLYFDFDQIEIIRRVYILIYLSAMYIGFTEKRN